MSAHPSARYSVGDTVLVEQQGLLYDARVLSVRTEGGAGNEAERWWFVHYLGWHERWDMWVGEKETRRDSDAARAEQTERKQRQQASRRRSSKAAAGDRSDNKAVQHKRQQSSGDGQRQSGGGRGSSDIQPHRSSSSCSLSPTPAAVVAAAEPPTKRSRQAGRVQSADVDALRPEEPASVQERSSSSSSSSSSPSSSCFIPALPNSLRRRLVLDWEWTSRKQRVLRLPRSPSVSALLSRFVSGMEEATAAEDREAAMEVCCGLLSCFERCLGPLLLYRIERPQFQQQMNSRPQGQREPRQKRTQDAAAAAERKRGRDKLQRGAAEQEAVASGELAEQSLTGVSAALLPSSPSSSSSSAVSASPLFFYSGVYGAEHLLRLLVKLPAIIQQAEMTERQCSSIRHTLTLLYSWMVSNDSLLFSADAYAPVDRDYLQQIGAALAV